MIEIPYCLSEIHSRLGKNEPNSTPFFTLYSHERDMQQKSATFFIFYQNYIQIHILKINTLK